MNTFPMIRSLKSAVAGTVLVAVPMLLLSLSPLTGIYAAMLYLMVYPLAVCIVGAVCGLAPMAVDAMAGVYALGMLLGLKGAGLGAVYLLPILAGFLLLVHFRVPFWKGCAALICVHVAAFAGVYLWARSLAGGELYALAGDAAAKALSGTEIGDTLLYQFYSMGLIGLPDDLAQNAVQAGPLGYLTLSDAAREDLLLSVRALVENTLAAAVPNLIVSQSILGGVMCLYLPLRFGFLAQEKREFIAEASAETAVVGGNGKHIVNFPDLGMPPLSQWYLPRGIGWQVGAALILGYLLGSSGGAVGIAGGLLYAAAITVFQIQGAALINFMQKAKGSRRLWRVLVPIVLMLFSLLSYIGIFDQIVNIRGLRKPREPKEDEQL